MLLSLTQVILSDTRVPSTPFNFSWVWVVLTTPLLSRLFWMCSPLRETDLYFSHRCRDVFKLLLFLKSICISCFISSREVVPETTTMNLTTIKLKHDCFKPWMQLRGSQAHLGWYCCWSEYDFHEFIFRTKTKPIE